MNGLGLIVGHLIGDYILQDDWQAANKSLRHFPCIVHCTLYTLAVWIFSFSWLPAWGLVVCWLAHFPVDRWRLARVLMRYTNHESFATGLFAPWSIIITDNTIHLAVLYLIGAIAGG